MVYRRLSEEVKADLQLTINALQERFEPASRKGLYRAELQSRRKLRSEDWATYGEELIRIAEKAYPDLPVEAQQRLALTSSWPSWTIPRWLLASNRGLHKLWRRQFS